MKMELPVVVPEWIKESWDDQFKVFPWYYFAIDLPTPIFIITTLKDNGLANAQLSTWGMMAGSGNEPKFILMVHNYTDTRKLIENTGEFVINFPGIDLKDKFRNTVNHFGEDTDEIIASGLKHENSFIIKTPRIEECFACFECKLDWIRDIESEVKTSSLVQGSIVHASIREDVLSNDIRETCEKRKWVYNIHEVVNPKTGVHEGGILTTLDVKAARDMDE